MLRGIQTARPPLRSHGQCSRRKLDLTLDIDIGQGEAAPFDLYLDVIHVTCVDLLFSQGM